MDETGAPMQARIGRSRVWRIALLLGALSTPALVWAQPDGYPGSHMMWNGGWFGMFFGLLLMVVFLAVIVAAVVFAIRWLSGSGRDAAAPPVKTPLDILKERYARGEIDKEEFEERRRVLGE